MRLYNIISKSFEGRCECAGHARIRPGDRFNRLVVIADSGERLHGQKVWNCRCDCGAFVKVSTNSLNENNTGSCGCLQKELARVRFVKLRAAHLEKLAARDRERIPGHTFGIWTVLPSQDAAAKRLICQCRCGVIEELSRHQILYGKPAKTCQHIGAVRRGDRFGSLLVVDDSGKRVHRRIVWSCRCDCGNTIEATKRALISGRRRSCGCHDEAPKAAPRHGA